MKNTSNVAVIGLSHLGTVAAACFAASGHRTIGIDKSEQTVESLSKGIPTIYEPGLENLVKDGIKKGLLSFTNDYAHELMHADYVVIAFDTPINDDDTPDLSPILKSVAECVPHLMNGVLFVVSSQVPLGTCEQIKAIITKKRPSLDFGIACVPENIKLGESISRFNSPDFLVIGATRDKDFASAERLYGFVKGPRIKVDLKTAEMVKHALNAFLASQVSFSNELGNLSDMYGVDWSSVAEALHLDSRVGKGALLRAGLGFAGGTLARDVGVLQTLGKKGGTKTELLDAVMRVNSEQNMIIASKLKTIFGRFKGLKIGVLGLTYKPGTSAIKGSASMEIIRELVKGGARVKAYDPKASYEKSALGFSFERCESAAAVAKSSDALLILTGWPEFKELGFGRMKAAMSHPVVIDAVNMLDADTMGKHGYIYMGIGRGHQAKRM